MNIQQQDGIVSTIQFVPYSATAEYQDLRNSIFAQATQASSCSPSNQTDVFDESIMVFDSFDQALVFLIQLFRASVALAASSGINIKLKSSLCQGSYFVHQDQIYGEAVNLATRLSCTSRENELRVCGIDPKIIDTFMREQGDLSCYIREQDENCVSISLKDEDSTNAAVDNIIFQVDCNHQSKNFQASRLGKIHIGRSDKSDIYIMGDHISRSHATITIHYGSAVIEDHSANGTYVYPANNHEVFLNNDSMKIDDEYHISCGLSRDSNAKSSDVIHFQVRDLTLTPSLKN